MAKVEAASLGGDPDFPGHPMAIDDDLASIGKFNLQDATRCQFEIEISIAALQTSLDADQRSIRQRVEFGVVHACATIFRFTASVLVMTRIAAVVIVLCVAACGIKGPLELPPNSGSPTATKDVSTAQRTTNR